MNSFVAGRYIDQLLAKSTEELAAAVLSPLPPIVSIFHGSLMKLHSIMGTVYIALQSLEKWYITPGKLFGHLRLFFGVWIYIKTDKKCHRKLFSPEKFYLKDISATLWKYLELNMAKEA